MFEGLDYPSSLRTTFGGFEKAVGGHVMSGSCRYQDSDWRSDVIWMAVCDESDSSPASDLSASERCGESGSCFRCWARTSDSCVSDVCRHLLDEMQDSEGSDGRQCESRRSCLCSSSALWANMMLTFLWWARASSLSFSYSRKHTSVPNHSSASWNVKHHKWWWWWMHL